MDTLKDCYENLKSLVGEKIEPFEIVNMVHAYREYWKPERTRVILLAESHVYTTADDFKNRLNLDGFDLPSYPDRYVRFVYCLGYGENGLVGKKLGNNHGTPDFWKIFYSSCNPITSHDDFHPVLKKDSRFKARMTNKIKLLEQMRETGIWLLDASIIGINNSYQPSPDMYQEILSVCWHKHIEDIIRESAPDHIICIGKGVSKVLEGKIKHLTGEYPASVPLPSAFLSSGQKLNLFEKIWATCEKYHKTGHHAIHADMHVGLRSAQANPHRETEGQDKKGGLTIAEAKKGLSITFGVPADAIEIIING